MDPNLAKLLVIAATFPSIAHRNVRAIGDLRIIAADATNSAAPRNAARFLLEVWDAAIGKTFVVMRFAFRESWESWDAAHRAAFQAYVAAGCWTA